MRVRKPTSKRVSTRMREGIKKKAAAQKRKEAKLAKKNPQWKSRKPKPMGIPSNFPYKEDIIQELEAKQTAAEEEKRRAREAKRAERAAGAAEQEEDDGDMEMEEDDDGNNGLSALVESAQRAAEEYEGEGQKLSEEQMARLEEQLEFKDWDMSEFLAGNDDEDSDVVTDVKYYQNNVNSDKSLKSFNKFFQKIIEVSDVVLYVLDARDPEATRNSKIEEMILKSQNKKLIYLLNKVDLVPNDVLNSWISYYKGKFPILPIKATNNSNISVSNNFNKNLSNAVTCNGLLQSLKKYANASDLKRSIVVGIVGFPNVGKSSIINALVNKFKSGSSNNSCPVGNKPGITTTLREVKIDNKLKIVDSPGIIFPVQYKHKNQNQKIIKKLQLQQEAKLILLNTIPEKNIKDPMLAIQLLVKRLEKNEESFANFKKFYQLPEIANFDLEEYTKQALIHIARNRGRLGKGGVPNFHSTCMSILNDFKDGRFFCWASVPDKSIEEVEGKTFVTRDNGAQVEQKTIVSEWSKEFDLDALFKSVGV